MQVDDTIRATTIVNIRAEPGVQARIVDQLHEGDKRVIQGGPVMTGGLTWWAIPGGWVAEVATGGQRLLEVVLPLTAWQRSIAFVLKEEGGYSKIASDPGNWTGGKLGVGVLKGTNRGISAVSYPTLDIVNLTTAQAEAIYLRDFWPIAAPFPWPLCLAVFDLAVNGGKGRAQQALTAVGPNFLLLMAWRINWYTNLNDFPTFGRGWIRRCARLLAEAGNSM